MKERAGGPSTRRGHSLVSHALGAVTILFWASVVFMVVLMLFFWVFPGLRGERSFNLLNGACIGLVMVSSAYLFWRELRVIRSEHHAFRRERSGLMMEEANEWSPKAWLYATAFGLSSFIGLYLLPALFFSF